MVSAVTIIKVLDPTLVGRPAFQRSRFSKGNRFCGGRWFWALADAAFPLTVRGNMRSRIGWYLPAVMLMGCFGFAQGAMNGAVLNGNWDLSVASDGILWGAPLSRPSRLALTLQSDGDRLLGSGSLQTRCPADGSGMGTAFFLAGEIAVDGTFTLTEIPVVGPWYNNSQRIVIRGSVPRRRSDEWRGHFAFQIPKRKGARCAGEMAGDFVAAPRPRIAGVYWGRFIFGGTAASVLLELEQGAGMFGSEAGPLSLSAKMKVMFPENPGEAPVTYEFDRSSSFVRGDELYLAFRDRDGAKVTAYCTRADGVGQKLQVFFHNLRAPESSPASSIGVRLGGVGVLSRE